jgi:hypothetical protein
MPGDNNYKFPVYEIYQCKRVEFEPTNNGWIIKLPDGIHRQVTSVLKMTLQCH